MSPTLPPTINPSHSHTLSPGAIVGTTIGGAVVILLAVTLIYICGRQSRQPLQPNSRLPLDKSTPASPETGHATSISRCLDAYETQGYAEKGGYGRVDRREELDGSPNFYFSQPTSDMSQTVKIRSIETEHIPESPTTTNFVCPITPVSMEIPEILRYLSGIRSWNCCSLIF